MILTGPKIAEEVLSKAIEIAPFDKAYLNPNSYDVRLGDTLLVYDNKVLDAKQKNAAHTIPIPPEGLVHCNQTPYI